MVKVSWSRAAAWRVHAQHLDKRSPAGDMLAVASRLCGLHAQVISSAELSLWARVEDLERSAVARALWQQRTLVKTWAMRGTLHLLPAKELPLWHAALGTNPRFRRPAFWKRCFGITLAELDRLTHAIGEVLEGRVLTRDELAREVGRITGSGAFITGIAQGGWGTLLKPAAFAGLLCFAPSAGQKSRFTRPTRSRTATVSIDPRAAQAQVARRYLAAYGPATYHDFARWWGGGGVAAARQLILSLGEEVWPVEVEGSPAWMLSADVRAITKLPRVRSVRLLPAFDQYVVAASRHAEHLLPNGFRSRIYRPQGWISAVLLVNGQMQGTWRHEIRGRHVDVVIEPFAKLPGRVRVAAEEEALLLARFLGGGLRLKWTN